MSTHHAIRNIAAALLAALAATAAAHADNEINLSLVGPSSDVVVGQTFEVKLRAASLPASNLVGVSFIGIDCVIKWDPTKVQLLGLSSTGSVPLMNSYLPSPASDYTGVNESSPPADGNALYYAFANFGNPVQVSSNGVQVTTFRFKAIAEFQSSKVEILPSYTVRQRADTVVYDGTVPGLDVLGAISAATVTQAPPCRCDLDGDGIVGGGDLGVMLNNWGAGGSGDFDGDGVVNGRDLGILLSRWGQSTVN